MKRLIPLLVMSALACQWSSRAPTSFSTPYPPEYIPTVVAMTAASWASPMTEVIDTPTSGLPSPTSTLSFSPTLAPYEQYTIDTLRGRTYGGGNIEVVEALEDKGSFTRYLILYPSDGLTIYGFANVPKGAGPYPIIIFVHGYVNIADYETLDYTTDSADGMTQAGYIVLHPNLRNYPPSDNGDNLFRVGMAVDALNLIALVKSGAMPSELSATASPDRIGLWGHSLGGNIVLRVLTVSSDVKAAVLYASLSGDEAKNAQLLSRIVTDPSLQTELTTSPALIHSISPSHYYKGITAPIQLYHGTSDSTVPVGWAQETCGLLKDAGVAVNCIYYTDEDHTFRSRVSVQFVGSQIDFFRIYLSP